MRFSDAFLDEIRARLPLSQVVGRHVQFDRKRSHPSRGDFWACCPFHHEKTPSFHVDDRKGFYYCFGCHAKGEHFRFLMEKEGLSFTEAVAQLAAEAGLELPKPDPKEAQRQEQRLGLMEVLEEAASFYQKQFLDPANAEARTYAERRGLRLETISTFRIGFAPDAHDALLKHFRRQGVAEELLAEAGLIAVPEDGGKPYDRFRNRLMFPIRDARGRVIAFGGRALGEARAKYLNSPETPVFHKSNVLFNLDLARKPAFERGEVIAVEGYMDVIALYQAGIRHAVAPLGTALTEPQLMLLWRMAAQPVMCFDGDEAGRKAAWRALETALPHLRPGHSLKFAFLPEGMDPDDLVRAEGAAAFLSVVEEAESLIDFLFRHATDGRRLKTPEEKAALEAEAEELAGRIQDAKVRQHYLMELRDRLRALFGRGGGRAFAGGRGGYSSARGGAVAVRFAPPPSPRLRQHAHRVETLGPPAEQDVLRVLLLRPELIADAAEALADFPFSTQALDSLAQAILHICHAADGGAAAPLETEGLLAHLQDSDRKTARRLLAHGGRRRLSAFLRPDVEEAVRGLMARLEEMHRERMLRRELALAEAAWREEQSEEALARLQQVRGELDALLLAGEQEEN